MSEENPKAVEFRTLKSISEDVLRKLGNQDLRNRLEYKDYHNFGKARLPDDILQPILEPLLLTTDDVQIEVVHVSQDLTNQIHHHNDATAYIIMLGSQSGFPEPKDAYIYSGNGWHPVKAGDKIKISPKMNHGFTIAPGGDLYFLTVQSPAIVRKQGADDYTLHDPVPLEGNIISAPNRLIERPDSQMGGPA